MITLKPSDRSDDRALLERLYHTYKKQMFYLAQSILQDEMAAEDTVQDVFLRIAARHIPVIKKITDPADLRNYLLKATKNTALNQRKRRNMERVSTTDLGEIEEMPDEDFLDRLCTRAEYDALLRAMEELDEIYRDVLYYHFVMELSVPETALALGRKRETVKKQLARGKKLLLEQLDPTKEGNDRNG